MEALVAFNRGNLDEALRLAKQAVSNDPGDAPARNALAELLCFAGEFERADAQLDALSNCDPSTAVAVAHFRRLIRAEVARHDLERAGRVPELRAAADGELRLRLQALVALRGAAAAEAAELLARAEAQRLHPVGTVNGEAFSDFRDADDLLGSVLEVLAADGRYFWLPLTQVRRLAFDPPQYARDLLFRQTRLVTDDGAESTVWLPVLYAGSSAAAQPDLRLGRTTDWVTPHSDVVRGVGQRVFLCGERDYGLLELREVQFQEFRPGPGSA